MKKHPLNDLLNLEDELPQEENRQLEKEEQTEQSLPDVVSEHLPAPGSDNYDLKDQEIEYDLNEIKQMALDVYKSEIKNLEYVDPKYKSRRLEAVVKFLDVALSAIKEKKSLKTHKDNIELSTKQATKQNNTYNAIFVGNRNELLKMIASGEKIVEGDVIDIDTDNNNPEDNKNET